MKDAGRWLRLGAVLQVVKESPNLPPFGEEELEAEDTGAVSVQEDNALVG